MADMVTNYLRAFCAISISLLSSPAIAAAPPIVSADSRLNDIVCAQGDQEVAPDFVRTRLIVAAKLPLTADIVNALEKGQLGALAARSDGAELTGLLTQATALMQARPDDSVAKSVRYTLILQQQDKAPRDQAVAFLNGAPVITEVSCTKLADPAPIVVLPQKEPLRLVLVEGKNDLIKNPNNRAFASLGFEEDRASSTRTVNANLAVALEPTLLFKPSDATELRWSPFLQYNRRATKSGREEVNDLTLGTSFVFRKPSEAAGAIGFGSLAFQTDDEAKAEVWVADALVDFPGVAPCTHGTIKGWSTRCNMSFVVDFANVDNPGNSVKLANLDTYLRTGVNFGLRAEQAFPIGVIAIDSSYTGRYDVYSGEASGAIFAIGAGLRPSASSNISLETRYSRGTTLNTLVDVDQITFRIGYRM